MKKIIITLLVFVSFTASFAHDNMLPHVHENEVNYLGMFFGYVVLSLIVVFGVVKFVKYLKYKRA